MAVLGSARNWIAVNSKIRSPLMQNIKRIDPQKPAQSMPLIRSVSTVVANKANKGVQLQPSNTGRVQFLLIVAAWHGTDLLYKINGLIAVCENNTRPAPGQSNTINRSGR
jgi:hypothetical protein